MSVRTVKVSIKGISPLLMHQYPMTPVEAMEKKSVEEQAEIAAYRDPDGNLFVPGLAIQRCLIKAAAFSKGKGRASLQKPVAACIMISPERCLLGVKEYIIDVRPVVVPATKGRILRARPRLDQWQVNFSIEYDDVLLTEGQLRRVLDDAGSRVGLLDFRPEKNGSFGRFMTVNWNA